MLFKIAASPYNTQTFSRQRSQTDWFVVSSIISGILLKIAFVCSETHSIWDGAQNVSPKKHRTWQRTSLTFSVVVNPNTNILFNLFWISFCCALFTARLSACPTVSRQASHIWCVWKQFYYSLYAFGKLGLDLCVLVQFMLNLWDFAFSLANFHFLKSIFYLQVFPVLLCLIIHVVSRSRNSREEKGAFEFFS